MNGKPSQCVHFNGTVNDCCDAGVNYRQLVGGPDFGWCRRLPCMDKYAKPDAVSCDKKRYPTEEEMVAYEKAVKESTERFLLTVPLITGMKARYRNRSGQETVECPACKGRLHMTISSINGHVWGRCDTEGCLAWME